MNVRLAFIPGFFRALVHTNAPGGYLGFSASHGNVSLHDIITYIFSCNSDSTRYRQLGNAVVPQIAEWLGRRLLEAIGATA
jgi:site-specific DNA-cytosine methylase